MLDQLRLPHEEVYHTYKTWQEVADAIKTMVIRGAPAIGVAGAMGLALGALSIQAADSKSFFKQLNDISTHLFETRPTAVNLGWGLARMKNVAEQNQNLSLPQLKQKLIDEAQNILTEDIRLNETMGSHGQILFESGDKVLTHCNAGALATAGFGTALGVLYAAWKNGKRFSVLADETRPYLQGARLTAWELHKNNIPVTLISDNMAGWLMKKGEITKVIVGADRIAANGDVANKIGTYTVAVLAHRHQIPFYVAAPLSTIDLTLKSGDDIPIEERSSKEVTHLGNVNIAPVGVLARHPAFDVTPNELISAIITEKGVVKKSYVENLKKLFVK